MEELANWARAKLLLKDIKVGFFSSQAKCFSGSDLFSLLSDKYPKADDMLRMQICQDLITHQFIHPVLNNYIFSNDSTSYYVFQCDKQTILHNMVKIWYGDVRKPLEVSCDLIKQLNKVILELRPLSSNQLEIPPDYSKNSKEYKKFLDLVCELQKVELDVKKIDRDEILAFILNIYQVIKQ